MNKILFTAILLFVLFSAESCKDSLGLDSNVSKEGNGEGEDWSAYFQWHTGNYWMFDSYLIDKDGNETIWEEGKKQEVAEALTFEDRNCLEGKIYTATDFHHMSVYHYLEGSKFYSTGSSYFINWSFDPYNLWDLNNWVLTCDLEKDSWTGFKDDNVEITFDDHVSFKGSIHIHGFMGEDTIIAYKGENRICKKIINYCDVEGTFSYFGEEIDVGKPSRLEVRMYYSKGIGWLAMENYFLTPYMPWVDNANKGYTCRVTEHYIQE